MQAAKTKGKFITVEGQDGAGKSTNIEVIEAFLKAQGIDLVLTREPGGTQLGESLRQLLLETDEYKITDLSELLLIFAARSQHLEEVIRPALNKGRWVLCDRFTDATYAYQGGGRELPLQAIAELENLVQNKLRPDLTLLLDLPVELGADRVGQRCQPDRFEKEQQDFKARVRSAYLKLEQQYPQRIKKIDSSQSLAHVATSIHGILTEFISSQ